MSKCKLEQAQAIEALRTMLKPGDTVYTTLKHVSRSGMSRSIDLHVMQDNAPVWIARRVATACGMTYDEKRECVKVSGCGMDMGFHIVYELSHALYKDGFTCLGDKCPSNDHANAWYVIKDELCPSCECPLFGSDPSSELSERVKLESHNGNTARDRALLDTLPKLAGNRVCQACADKGLSAWTHKDGGYSLKHRWM